MLIKGRMQVIQAPNCAHRFKMQSHRPAMSRAIPSPTPRGISLSFCLPFELLVGLSPSLNRVLTLLSLGESA